MSVIPTFLQVQNLGNVLLCNTRLTALLKKSKNVIIHIIGLWKTRIALPVQVKPFCVRETVWCQRHLKKNFIFTVTGANSLLSLNFP